MYTDHYVTYRMNTSAGVNGGALSLKLTDFQLWQQMHAPILQSKNAAETGDPKCRFKL